MSLDDILDAPEVKPSKNKPLKILERFFFIVFLIGWIFKELHLKGADYMLLLSLTFLALLYLLSGFWFFPKLVFRFEQLNKPQLAKRLSVLAGFTLFVQTIGILFTMLQTPGHQKILLTGLAIGGVWLLTLSYSSIDKSSWALRTRIFFALALALLARFAF